jgi:L-malate glycosyltransferase
MAGEKVSILFVSGFVADTYSEIEKQYVDLCSKSAEDVEFLWLVPEISYKHNRFARADSRSTLGEPVWVTHLRSRSIPFIQGNISKYNVITNWRLFRNIFRNNRIDAVYTHFGYERFWATFFGKLWGKVTIWNEHWHSLGTRYVLPKRLFYRLFVDNFIAVSNFIADTLPIDSQLHVVRNAIQADIDVRGQAGSRARLRDQLKIREDVKLILLVSAFRPEKHHELAIKVCERVLRKRNDVVFLFLGEGVTRPFAAGKAQELGIDQKIIMTGHVDNVDEYYMASDICMLTSLGEPCALAVVEAMKFAKPLVAFNSGGTPERIRNGQSGVLLDERDTDGFADALVDLIENDAKRSHIGANALAAVREQADRGKWVTQLRLLLHDIVKGKSVAVNN